MFLLCRNTKKYCFGIYVVCDISFKNMNEDSVLSFIFKIKQKSTSINNISS